VLKEREKCAQSLLKHSAVSIADSCFDEVQRPAIHRLTIETLTDLHLRSRGQLAAYRLLKERARLVGSDQQSTQVHAGLWLPITGANGDGGAIRSLRDFPRGGETERETH
jgi:hypothetical protein